ncbi:MAG: IS605 OrfB-like transposable element containing RNAse H-like and Zn finger domain [Candidatus Methanohalarchaeum thermophilum]|uniref:IS605 OrfB-like transposable element containing RNAse H-like and Zn finger domain n=1 Tax=Methanohalarchaeum thermophilum TaxID=1903181 RepID=A0A1Q6DV43_METT1|nr:MAG: IS605 OrfB-like transposable element containing RNAse H-like and Zn finger domain [Candidatus Methanohalarchaeum thermophilum]
MYCGDGKGWKQEISLGDSNNEKFVEIPFDWFKQKLKHKLEYYGIDFMLVDEFYTSKCNALANTEVRKKPSYRGKRTERGLYKTSDGTLINADVNGALNIAKKGMSETNLELGVGSSGGVDTPRRIRKPFGLGYGSNISESLIQTSPETPT